MCPLVGKGRDGVDPTVGMGVGSSQGRFTERQTAEGTFTQWGLIPEKEGGDGRGKVECDSTGAAFRGDKQSQSILVDGSFPEWRAVVVSPPLRKGKGAEFGWAPPLSIHFFLSRSPRTRKRPRKGAELPYTRSSVLFVGYTCRVAWVHNQVPRQCGTTGTVSASVIVVGLDR